MSGATQQAPQRVHSMVRQPASWRPRSPPDPGVLTGAGLRASTARDRQPVRGVDAARSDPERARDLPPVRGADALRQRGEHGQAALAQHALAAECSRGARPRRRRRILPEPDARRAPPRRRAPGPCAAGPPVSAGSLPDTSSTSSTCDLRLPAQKAREAPATAPQARRRDRSRSSRVDPFALELPIELRCGGPEQEARPPAGVTCASSVASASSPKSLSTCPVGSAATGDSLQSYGVGTAAKPARP